MAPTRPLMMTACSPGFNANCRTTSLHAFKYFSYSALVSMFASVSSSRENGACFPSSTDTSELSSPRTLRRRPGATFESRFDVTSCAMERDGLASDSAWREDAAGLWMKEKRLSDSGVCNKESAQFGRYQKEVREGKKSP